MELSRRAILGTAACLGLSSKLFPFFEAAVGAESIRTRQNIKAFAADPGKVSALRAAVGHMKELSNSNRHDPFGWSYWASSHGSPDPPSTQEPKDPNAMPLYRQCKHGGNGLWEPHFLSWHRVFLFFFEAVLKQAAVESRETTAFDLPYWNWYEDPLPQIFKEGDEKTNPLYVRGSLAGGSVDLDKLIPGLSTAPFLSDDFLIAPGVPQENTFLYQLDENPHGTVHDLVAGDMGRVPTAARDPIFWFHHVNLDRLWTAWMKSGSRRLPARDSAWGRTSWFFDPSGNWKATAGDMLNSETSFGYRYDDETLPSVSVAVASALPSRTLEALPPSAAMAPPMDEAAPSSTATTLSQTAKPIVLGNKPISVKFKIASDTTERLRALAPQSEGRALDMLVLKDVEVGADGKNGGFHYNIVASLTPADGGPPRRVYIGSIGTFSLSVLAHRSGHTHEGEDIGKQTLTFPLADVLATLAPITPKDLEDGLRITLEPVQPSTQDSSEFVKIDSIKLQTSTVLLQKDR